MSRRHRPLPIPIEEQEARLRRLTRGLEFCPCRQPVPDRLYLGAWSCAVCRRTITPADVSENTTDVEDAAA